MQQADSIHHTNYNQRFNYDAITKKTLNIFLIDCSHKVTDIIHYNKIVIIITSLEKVQVWYNGI